MGKQIIEAVCATSAGVERQQIVFDDQSGLILQVGPHLVPPEQVTQTYGDDCLLFAGMGDIHIHAREDVSGLHLYKEDFHSASLAAINGGVCHVCDMPNNPTPPIDDHSYLAKLALTKKGLIPIVLYAGVGPATNPLSFKVPYKVYMGPSIGELFFTDDKACEAALERYRGQIVSFHCEDPQELELHKMQPHHHERRPISAEVMATETALKFIEQFSLQGKLCHYSAATGLPLIRAARARGVDVTCEVTPQHLYFAIEDLAADEWQLYQMNPPIRTRGDREAMLEALRDGTIDYLATDHAPHSIEEKRKGTSGLTGLDSYGAFVTWLIKVKGFTPQRIAQVCSENPAKFVNQFLSSLRPYHSEFAKLGLGFGKLQKDYVASFTVLNMNSPCKLLAKDLKTKVGHNPFLGIEFPGHVTATWIQGRKMS